MSHQCYHLLNNAIIVHQRDAVYRTWATIRGTRWATIRGTRGPTIRGTRRVGRIAANAFAGIIRPYG